MGGRAIVIGLVLLAAACGGDDDSGADAERTPATIRSGTVEEFCARYQELAAAYADVPAPETLGDVIDALEVAIDDYQRLPIPTELADDAQASLTAMEEAVDSFEELDASMDIDAPTLEQQEQLDAVAKQVEDSQAGASSMREFATEHCG